MAKQRNKKQQQDTSSIDTSLFTKGMVKDMNASFQGKGTWSHARNAYNNSEDGDVGVIGNEPSNFSCADVPYTIIGGIHLYADKWVIFSTDDINSEIGLFDDSECTYETLVNYPCLNFRKCNLIKGAAKENFDCTWQIYWDDVARNPSRTMNINDIPWIQQIVSPFGADCIEYIDTTDLDCEKIRLAPLIDTPCVELTEGIGGGSLRNGMYQVYIAYTINDQKIGDYIGISNMQSIWNHNNTMGSLSVKLSNLDTDFDYYELVLLSNWQNQIQAKKIGLYSTNQTSISIDYIDVSLPVVPVELLPLRNPAYEKSDSMYVVNDWLIRSGPTEQFDFNYQPLANKIETRWVSTKYPADYYYNGGNKPTFLRDEIYSFFIRWIYNTGERSSSYHIPGRPEDPAASPAETSPAASPIDSGDRLFELNNTASVIGSEPDFVLPFNLPDQGVVTNQGYMAYWESTERYPNEPEIWDDLCGKPIRHHKMPYENTDPSCELSTSVGSGSDRNINLIGVRFKNIPPPVDNDGNVITNIVGYEILRGSRENQQSILAKGIFRNMRMYTINANEDEGQNSIQGYYPNYPYNDLRGDIYHTSDPDFPSSSNIDCGTWPNTIVKFPPLFDYSKKLFTFHSPDLMFSRPFLNGYYTSIYGSVSGGAVGHFIKSEDHPQHKLIRNAALLIAGMFGIGYALEKIRGRVTTSNNATVPLNLGIATNIAYPGVVNTTYVGAPYIGPLNSTATTPINLNLRSPGANATSTANQTGKTAADFARNAAWNLILNALINTGAAISDIATGGIATNQANTSAFQAKRKLDETPGTGYTSYIGGSTNIQNTGSEYQEIPEIFRVITSVYFFVFFASEGAQKIIDAIYSLISYQDFAWKYNSHGLYGDWNPKVISNNITQQNTRILEQGFIDDSITAFAGGKINNLQRPGTVAIRHQNTISNPTVTDKSRFTIGSEQIHANPGDYKSSPISANYGAIKFQIQNLYGQLDGIKQIPIRSCVQIIDKNEDYNVSTRFSSEVMFGGDNYVNRYTEKTTMPFFWDFLRGQPDGYPFNYSLRQNIPHPRFWMDTQQYNTSRFMNAVTSFSATAWENALPNDLYYMDRPPNDCNTGGFDQNNNILGTNGSNPFFNLKHAYMYTHNNGVQDFFVESETNMAQRDWEDPPEKRHFDWKTFGEYDDLFRAEIIKDGNFYKYDYSLSISKFPSTLTSWGSIQPRDYSPEIAETCFSYYPKRLIYSLQAKQEAKKDFWRVFLPNNYKDFKSKVNVIKPINKSGALVMFPYLSPQMFQGLDTLRTDLGTKLTIGDGGLFTQPFQNVVNSDISNEYGSCESERSVVNTPAGLFFLSQAQGKVFHYTGTLENIANKGMKWWFNKYLPSQLLKRFPEIEDTLIVDNPVAGIGCQTIYDINDDIVYFCKKDYICNPDSYMPYSGEHVPNDPIQGIPPPYPPGPGHGAGNARIKPELLPVFPPEPSKGTPVCDCIEYDEKNCQFVLNTSLPGCGGAPIQTCPPGYTWNSVTEMCERELCVNAVWVETTPPLPEYWCCCSGECQDMTIAFNQPHSPKQCIDPCYGDVITGEPWSSESECNDNCPS